LPRASEKNSPGGYPELFFFYFPVVMVRIELSTFWIVEAT
jgi:hypothetical protein